MKIVVFKSPANDSSAAERFKIGAIISESEIVDLTMLTESEDLSAIDLLKCFDLQNRFVEKAKSAIASENFRVINRRDIKIVAPLPRPGKIICIGLNYRNHAEESGMPIPESPIIFSKFATSIIGANEPIIVPKNSLQVDYEAELAFVIGRAAKNIKKEDAFRYVFGFTNFNDVSARDFQFADGQWQRGKSCDTFAPLGEYVATTDEIGDPHNLQIQFRLNGETLQNSNTSELIFKIPELIEFLSQSITLEPGDIIATGTPPGVGFARKPSVFMKKGDVAEVEIEGLGILSNPVLSENSF